MLKNIRRLVLTGLLIFISSEIYLSMFVSDFRISPAVIVYPVLLLTSDRDCPLYSLGLFTFLMVFLGRLARYLLSGTALSAAVPVILPGAFFYVTYTLFFALFIRNRYTTGILRAGAAAAACDLLSNCLEIVNRHFITDTPLSFSESLFKMAGIALLRAVIVCICLMLIRQYHALLKQEEHEKRYRRLFLMTAELKSEAYLMEKNSRQIEQIMKDAYTLYEKLGEGNYPPEFRSASLDIARKVHDIKKDYYRVIRGLEEEIGKNPDTSEMAVEDLLRILTETMQTDISSKSRNSSFTASADWSFKTGRHFSLMSVLLNLVTNAVEAIEGTGRKGTVSVQERLDGDEVVFEVTDNGPGIPEKRLPVIFDMGYSSKFDEKTGNVYRGVGLCSVKQIVEEQFKGTISVRSEEGKGSCFTVRIPKEELVQEKEYR